MFKLTTHLCLVLLLCLLLGACSGGSPSPTSVTSQGEGDGGGGGAGPETPVPPGSPVPPPPGSPVPPVPAAAGSRDIVYTQNLFLLRDVYDTIRTQSHATIGRLNPDTGEARTLITHPTYTHLMPSWNADKTKIVFSSNRDAGANLDLWIMNADGSAPLQLTQANGHQWTPAFSPNGQAVAYASTERAAPESIDKIYSLDIFVVDIATRQTRCVANNGNQDEDPIFSADGTKIYFVSQVVENDTYSFRIYEVAANQNNCGPATPLRIGCNGNGTPIQGQDPSLSRDGQTLYYSSPQGFASFNLSSCQETLAREGFEEPWVGPQNQVISIAGFNDAFDVNTQGGYLYLSDTAGNPIKSFENINNVFFPRW